MTFPAGNPPKPRNSKKPSGWRRVLAVLCLALYTLMGCLRFFQGIAYRSLFAELALWPDPLYIILSGAAIALGFSLVLLLVLLKNRHAPRVSRWLGTAFLLWLWIDRIWLGRREAFFHQALIGCLISLVTLLMMHLLIRRKDFRVE
jgi:uncharacterized membrane protein